MGYIFITHNKPPQGDSHRKTPDSRFYSHTAMNRPHGLQTYVNNAALLSGHCGTVRAGTRGWAGNSRPATTAPPLPRTRWSISPIGRNGIINDAARRVVIHLYAVPVDARNCINAGQSHTPQRSLRNADCRGGVFATRRFPRPAKHVHSGLACAAFFAPGGRMRAAGLLGEG